MPEDNKIKEQQPQGIKALSATDILSQKVVLEVKWVSVPEWGGGVWVRELTGIERDRFEASLVKGRGQKRQITLIGSRARLVAMGCIEGPSITDVEDGNAPAPNGATAKMLFTPRDVKKLSNLGARGIEKVSTEVRVISGIVDDEDADDEDVADLGNGQSDGSG